MRVVFAPGTDIMRWAWTEGLHAYDQAEIAVPITWDHGNWRDDQVSELLEGFGAYIRQQPKRIVAGEHMQHFWTVLRFRASVHTDTGLPSGMLVVQELAEPLRDVESTYTDGAQRAIMLLMRQRYAVHLAGLDTAIDPPYAWMSAELCRRVNPYGGSPLELQRRVPRTATTETRQAEDDESDSGWLIACTDPTHAHDEAGTTAHVHLVHVVQHYLRIFPYLALPAGSRVCFDGETASIFRPGNPTPLHDTSRPFTGFQ
jgi:hypothetical protein